MTLRALINRLEVLAQNGKNDHMEVQVENPFDPYQNDFAINAYISRYISENHEYDYVLITTIDD